MKFSNVFAREIYFVCGPNDAVEQGTDLRQNPECNDPNSEIMHRYVADRERDRGRQGEPFVSGINPLNYSFIENVSLYEYANVLNEIEIANELSGAIRNLD